MSRADDAEGEPGPRRHLRHGDDGDETTREDPGRRSIYGDLPIRQRLVLRAGVYKVYKQERHESYVHAGTYTISP